MTSLEYAVERKMRRYTCPLCGRSIRVPEKYIGQTGACKLCGGRITIKEQEALAAPRKSRAHSDILDTSLRAPERSTLPENQPPAPMPASRAVSAEQFFTPPIESPAVSAPEPLQAAARAQGAQESPPVRETAGAPAEPVVESKQLGELENAPPEKLVEWLERLPRSTLSVREIDVMRGKPTYLSDDELARSKAFFDVPFLVSRKAEALVIAKTTQDNVGPGTSQAVASGSLEFEARYHRGPEYPILQLLFTVNDHPERPLRFESLPLLTDGNVIEFAATALKERRMVFALYAGSQSHHVATGALALNEDVMRDFAAAIAQALRQWHEQHPKASDHDIAAARFAREHPLSVV